MNELTRNSTTTVSFQKRIEESRIKSVFQSIIANATEDNPDNIFEYTAFKIREAWRIQSNATPTNLHPPFHISIPDSQSSLGILVPRHISPKSLFRSLTTVYSFLPPLPPAVLLNVGGALEDCPVAIPRLFNEGLARLACSLGAVVIDGGTHHGVMRLMSRGCRGQGGTTHVGVIPRGRVCLPQGASVPTGACSLPSCGADGKAQLDTRHSHFLFVDADHWGGETCAMFALVAEYARRVPVVCVLTNGGQVACLEALSAVRARIPLIVLEGSGRLADEIAAHHRRRLDDAALSDAALSEIIAHGTIHLFPTDGTPEDLIALAERILNAQHAGLPAEWPSSPCAKAPAIGAG